MSEPVLSGQMPIVSEEKRAANRRMSLRFADPAFRAKHAAAVRRGRATSSAFGLTPREREVVQAIVDGLSNIAIGERLLISKETVKRHLFNIFNKTGAESRLQLSTFAISNGIAPAPAPRRSGEQRTANGERRQA